MKTVKDLELSLLLKEKEIQDLKLDRAKCISDEVKQRELKIALQQRIDKAIEYIEKHTQYRGGIYLGTKEKRDILDILKGVDKE